MFLLALKLKAELQANRLGNNRQYWNFISKIAPTKKNIMLKYNNNNITNLCDIVKLAHINYTDLFTLKKNQIDEKNYLYITNMVKKMYNQSYKNTPLVLVDILIEFDLGHSQRFI